MGVKVPVVVVIALNGVGDNVQWHQFENVLENFLKSFAKTKQNKKQTNKQTNVLICNKCQGIYHSQNLYQIIIK